MVILTTTMLTIIIHTVFLLPTIERIKINFMFLSFFGTLKKKKKGNNDYREAEEFILNLFVN